MFKLHFLFLFKNNGENQMYDLAQVPEGTPCSRIPGQTAIVELSQSPVCLEIFAQEMGLTERQALSYLRELDLLPSKKPDMAGGQRQYHSQMRDIPDFRQRS